MRARFCGRILADTGRGVIVHRHRSTMVRRRHAAGPASAPEPSPTGPASHMFVLQQHLGNAAVARMLQRTVQRDDDKGWGDAVPGGWNEDKRTIEDIDRYPIADLGDFGVEQSGQSD